MFEEGRALKRERGSDKVFDFSLGNPYGNPPEKFYEVLLDLLSHPTPGMHSYMANAGYEEARSARGKELEKLTGRRFTRDQVIMTAGAAGGINVALKALVNSGEKVILFSPYFVEYLFYIENHNGTPLILPTGPSFEPELGALAGALSNEVKAIILNTPNNPTGKIYSEAFLKELGSLIEEHEKKTGKPVYILSDEPYREIIYEGSSFHPPSKFIRNSIVLYSHSKDLNLPGERIGYAAVSPDATGSDSIFEAMVFANRILGFVNAPALMQRVSGKLVGEEAPLPTYVKNRKILSRIFKDGGLNTEDPEGAFYFFPRVPAGHTDLSFVERAKEEGILLVPGRGFGTPGYFRVAFCTSTEVVIGSEESWKRVFASGEGKS